MRYLLYFAISFILFLNILCSTSSIADTYYVDPNGNDSNLGSSGSPFLTLQKAADTVSPGDSVLVRDGHYTGFRLRESGTAASRIIFQAIGTEAIIDDGFNSNDDGIYLSNVSYVTIEGFKMQNLGGDGISHHDGSVTDPVRGLIIRGNTVSDCQQVGIYLSEVADSLVEDNEVIHCGWGSNTTHCMYMANAGTGGTTIRGNILHGCAVAGIHFNGDRTVGIGGDGIISGMTVEENTIYSNGQNGLNMDGVQDSLIRNNLIYNNAANGIRAYTIDAAAGPKNLVIVNNTIHVPSSSGGWAVRLTAEEGGNTVFNNILAFEGSGGSIAITNDDSNDFSSDNNAVGDNFTPDRDDTDLDLQEWQALGYDQHSLLAAPASLFIDYPNGNYQLSSSSPAIDAGRLTFNGHSAPATDMNGNLRPMGSGIDMGAYEFGGSPDTEPPSTPTNVQATVASGLQVDLSWQASTDNIGVSYYILYRNNQQLIQVPGTVYSDTTVQPNTVYRYGVQAVDWAGNSSGTALSNQVTTPVQNVVIDVRVSSSLDDAEEYAASGVVRDITSSDLEMVEEDYTQLVGIRFQNLNIPVNATILSAYIEFETDEASSTLTSLSITVQANDNSPAFAGENGNISNRITLENQQPGSSVSWANIEEWDNINEKHNSPNIKTLVQAIIDRPGWVANNSMVFIISGSGKRVAESYDGEQGAAPLLHVEYTVLGQQSAVRLPALFLLLF